MFARAGIRTTCSKTLFPPKVGSNMPIQNNISLFSRTSIKFASHNRFTQPFSIYAKFAKPQPNFTIINRKSKFAPTRDPTNGFKGKDGKILSKYSWIIGGIAGTYIVLHLEKDKSTGRWKMMEMSLQEERYLAQVNFLINYRTSHIINLSSDTSIQSIILSTDDPIHKEVEEVANRLIKSAVKEIQNGNIKADHLLKGFVNGIQSSEPPEQRKKLSLWNDYSDVKWQVFVINDPDPNVNVYPNGKIVVNTGILPICKDQNGLATLIGHGMAHVIARHTSEKIPGGKFLLNFGFVVSKLNVRFYDLSQEILMFLWDVPFSRQCEIEADQIGSRLMASACFDATQAPKVWERLKETEKRMGRRILPKWLNMHRLDTKRMQHMIDWIPEARKIRERSNCPNPSTITAFNFISANPPLYTYRTLRSKPFRSSPSSKPSSHIPQSEK